MPYCLVSEDVYPKECKRSPWPIGEAKCLCWEGKRMKGGTNIEISFSPHLWALRCELSDSGAPICGLWVVGENYCSNLRLQMQVWPTTTRGL